MRLRDQDRVVKWGRAQLSFSLLADIFEVSFFVISIFSNFFTTRKWLEIGLRKWYSLFEGR